MRRRRSVRAAVVLAVLVLVAGVGYAVGRRTAERSDAAEEQARAPAPTTLTEPVVEARIAPTIDGPVEVTEGDSTTIHCVPSSAVDARQVFTAPPTAPGTEVAEGAVVAEINARPVIVLAGAVPAYRDLRPDQRGGDVTQLQEALARLGHGDGTVDGHYGPSTWDAVRALYQARGYEPIGPTADELAAVDVAAREVEAASGRAGIATSQVEYDAAITERNAARDRLATLRATTGPSIPFCEILFVPALPAAAAAPPAGGTGASEPGSTPSAPPASSDGAQVTAGTPWLTLGAGEPTAEVVLSANAAEALEPGAPATFTPGSGRGEIAGSVREVRDGTPAVAVVELAGADASLDGTAGTMTITLPAPTSRCWPCRSPRRCVHPTARCGSCASGPRARGRRSRSRSGPPMARRVEVTSSSPELKVGDDLLVGVRGR